MQGVESKLKGAQGEQNRYKKESDKSKVREGRRQKRRGLCERLLGAVCLLQQFVCLLFVPGEVFKEKERTEL